MTKTNKYNEIRLGVINLSFHRITAAIVTQILEIMGKKVTRSYAFHEKTFENLNKNNVDFVCSAWLPNSHGVYKKYIEKSVKTRALGFHYKPYAFWGVPNYVPISEVREISDLAKPEIFSKMNPFIQGVGEGAGITRFSKKIMINYGLNKVGYTFRTGSETDCVTAFESAVSEKKWIIVPLWKPHFLHFKNKIRELEDTKHLLGGKDKAVLLARETNLTNLLSPEEIEVLDNIVLTNNIISQLDYSVNEINVNEDEAVRLWIQHNKEIVLKWLKPINPNKESVFQMNNIEDKLRKINIQLPEVAPALGNYEPFSIVNKVVMTSGQFPYQDGELKYTGKLGKECSLSEGYNACRLAALNAVSQLKKACGGNLGNIKQIYRVEGVLNVDESCIDHAKALNGASDVLLEIFGEVGRHSRMIWANPVLPLNSVCLVYLFAELK